MKKSFTMIEIVISVVIIGLMIGIIFRIYINVMDITTRVENEKIINTEALFVSQNIQNLSDKYQIDYEKYNQEDMIAKHGISKMLYLSGKNDTGDMDEISVYATGECEDNMQAIKTKFCRIQMNKNGELIDLTDKNKLYFKRAYFKIIPYGDVKKYNLEFNDIYQDGFWLFTESYIKRYNVYSRPFNVKLDYQSFFNIRRYDF